MTITNGYTTLTTVRSVLGIPSTDTSIDSLIEATVESVSRAIDNYTGRRFYTTSETRYFAPVTIDEIFIDDLASLSSLKTDDDADGTFETTWASGDYHLLPYNAALENRPYTMIEISGHGDYSFSCSVRKCVQIVGAFGYCSTANQPKPIAEAAKLQSTRLFKRKDAPFGVLGGGEFGQPMSIPDLDPDVKMLLSPYVRRV